MREAHKPEQGGAFSYFEQKYSDLDSDEAQKLLTKLERNGIPRELFLSSTEQFDVPVSLSAAIDTANKATHESGGHGISDHRSSETSSAR